jgi:hypothetical protein
MQARHELIEELKIILLKKLQERVSNKEEYSRHLHNFIVQVQNPLTKGDAENDGKKCCS